MIKAQQHHLGGEAPRRDYRQIQPETLRVQFGLMPVATEQAASPRRSGKMHDGSFHFLLHYPYIAL